MSNVPVLKIYNQANEYVGCLKYAEDAACLVAFIGVGATIRYGHNKKHTLWTEGAEIIDAGESYDQAAAIMNDRRKRLFPPAATA